MRKTTANLIIQDFGLRNSKHLDAHSSFFLYAQLFLGVKCQKYLIPNKILKDTHNLEINNFVLDFRLFYLNPNRIGGGAFYDAKFRINCSGSHD